MLRSCLLAAAASLALVAGCTSAPSVLSHQVFVKASMETAPAGARGDAADDPALWLHALETPPDRLYYLTPEAALEYQLATAID